MKVIADPHRSPPLDPAALQRIRRRILEGLSLRETAESVGRKRTQVVKAVRAMGGVKAIRREAELR